MRFRSCFTVLVSILAFTTAFAQGPVAPAALPSQIPEPTVCPCPSNQPFTSALFTQLQLTPCQTCSADRIANSVSQSLMVGIYPQGEFDNYLTNYVAVIPMDQLIAMQQEQVQKELSSCHPDPVVIANLSNSIAGYQHTRESVIAAAYTTICAMLTPEQRQRLPELAELLQQPACCNACNACGSVCTACK